MEIIPAIDLIDGKCVRLTKGDYNTAKIYNNTPLDVAMSFEDVGIKRLHVVDLEGAIANQSKQLKVLEQITNNTKLQVDFGGGIKTNTAAKSALNAGAMWITIGSLAIKDKNAVIELLEDIDATSLILGADVLNGKIAINGWKETSEWELMDFLAYYRKLGVEQVISTAIEQDGMLKGPDFGLYQKLTDINQWQVIASGGVSSIVDLEKLKTMGVSGAIVGKAYYEGYITLKQMAAWNNQN